MLQGSWTCGVRGIHIYVILLDMSRQIGYCFLCVSCHRALACVLSYNLDMPTTRSQDAPNESVKCHVINFDHADHEDCHLTVRVNDVCFLIMVQEARFHAAETIERRYRTLLKAVCAKKNRKWILRGIRSAKILRLQTPN